MDQPTPAPIADLVRPLRPGENPLADQLIEENDRLRRERNKWMYEAERIKREYDTLVASIGDLIHNCNAGECTDGEG